MWTIRARKRPAPLRAALVAALLAAAGCGSRHPYPKIWPALERLSTCDQLAGTYRDEGTSDSSGFASLSMLLVEPDGAIRRRPPETVTLSLSPGRELRASLNGSEGAFATLTFPPQHFTCEKGRLVLRAGARWFGNGPTYGLFAIGKESAAIELYRAADSLIVKKRVRTVSVVVVIPWTGKSEEWHRFQRVSPADPVRPEDRARASIPSAAGGSTASGSAASR